MSKVPELKQFYLQNVVPQLQKSRGYKNIHQIPKVTKVVINSGVSAQLDKGAVEEVAKELSSIAGQKAVVTKSRQSISNFKLRENQPIGAKVTLRGPIMWEFLYRLIYVALPNIRDFRGVGNKLDGKGNYNLGISDTTIFPEITVDGHKRTLGCDIVIVTTATSDEEGHELVKLLGMPFRKRESASVQTSTETTSNS
jgi:large subunit ribosomal protein L5